VILADDRKDLSKRDQALMAGENIKREAEFVKHLGDAEKIRKQEAMSNYKSELAAQVKAKNSQWTQSQLVDEHWQGAHTGLGIGTYNAEPTNDQLLNTLKIQVENKNKRFDQYQKIETNNANGDWLGRKQLIDKWNYNYIHDHRRHNLDGPKDNTRLLELKEMAIRENARKRRETAMEKQSDVDKVNDLVMNERHQKYQEHVRNKNKVEILQGALESQLQEKAAVQRINAEQKKRDAQGTSFVTGTVNRFGAVNYDQRSDIQLHNNIKSNNFVDRRDDDVRLVNNLDKYFFPFKRI
jgi:hypothetical protein